MRIKFPTSRFLASTAVAISVLATSVTPAMARHDRGWGYGRWHHRHRDRVDAGDVIAGIFVIGAIAAIASAASKAKDAKRTTDADPANSDRDDRSRDVARTGRIASEDDAVDACAEAVEEKAGAAASVRDITKVSPATDGWDVEGTVEERSDWRAKAAEKKRFTCSVRDGDVDYVYVDGAAVALR